MGAEVSGTALDPDNLPPRLLAREVAELFRFSKQTLARRRKDAPDWLPASAVQGGKETMFDRAAVLKALGVANDEQEPAANDPWAIAPDDLKAAFARQVRHRPSSLAQAAEGRRDATRVLPGPRKAPAVRLAVSNPSPAGR